LNAIQQGVQAVDQGIVQLYYYFEEQHNVLLLMEYASGGALFSYIRKGPRVTPGELRISWKP